MNKDYIYIIRRREQCILDEKIYKIEYSTKGIKKLMKYDDGAGFEVYLMFPVKDGKEVCKLAVDLFDDKYQCAYEETGSIKSFRGNVDMMIEDVKHIISYSCNSIEWKCCDDVKKSLRIDKFRKRFIAAVASREHKKLRQLTDKCIELGLQSELFNRNELLYLIDTYEKSGYHDSSCLGSLLKYV